MTERYWTHPLILPLYGLLVVFVILSVAQLSCKAMSRPRPTLAFGLQAPMDPVDQLQEVGDPGFPELAEELVTLGQVRNPSLAQLARMRVVVTELAERAAVLEARVVRIENYLVAMARAHDAAVGR